MTIDRLPSDRSLLLKTTSTTLSVKSGQLHLLANRPNEGLQGDTAVLAAHRGRGLGRQVKAAMLRRLVVQRPAVQRVLTSTAAGNTFMIDVNLSVGFHTVHRMIDVEADTTTLTSRLLPADDAQDAKQEP